MIWKRKQPPRITCAEPLAKKLDVSHHFAYTILGTWNNDTSQEYKNEIINENIKSKNFRRALLKFFPEYANKVKLWEKLHPEY